MSDATAARPRPELVDRIGELARETGSSPEELEAAAQEWAEHERWKAAKVQEALDELAAGAPTYDAEEVFAEMDAILEARLRDGRGHVAEKVAAMATEEVFAERCARAALTAFDRIMTRQGGEPPRPGDELPPDLAHLGPRR